MDVSKQIFDAFINRTLAYNYSTHIGKRILGFSWYLELTILARVDNI